MARKRLSDLLREEEQKGGEKSTEPETENTSTPAESDAVEPVVEVTGEVVASDDLSSARVELRNAAAEPAPEPEPAKPNDAQAIIQAELETTIEQLKAELKTLQQKVQAAQTQEATLQTQIDQLKTETTAQQKQIQQLQTEIAQSEQVKTELEAAKQMILKLSQPQPTANKAQPQPTATKAARPAPAVMPTVRAAEPELDSKPAEMIVLNKPAAAQRPKLHQMELRKLLDHPTQPGSLPPMPSEAKKPEQEKEIKLSDADVGWMD